MLKVTKNPGFDPLDAPSRLRVKISFIVILIIDFVPSASGHFVASERLIDSKRTVAHPFSELKVVYKRRISRIGSQIIKHPIAPKNINKYVAGKRNGTS